MPIMCCGDLVTQSCPTLVTPWTANRQAPLSMGFHRQEYWRGLPFPSPGDLLDPGMNSHHLPWQVGSLPLGHQISPACSLEGLMLKLKLQSFGHLM